jgi:hypothetical protein
MDLKDYTTEQLLEEIKRRKQEERKNKVRIVPKPVYEYKFAVLVKKNKMYYRKYSVVFIDENDIDKFRNGMEIKRINIENLDVVYGTKPKEGDLVKVRDRITKTPTRFWNKTAKICEVVEEGFYKEKNV